MDAGSKWGTFLKAGHRRPGGWLRNPFRTEETLVSVDSLVNTVTMVSTMVAQVVRNDFRASIVGCGLVGENHGFLPTNHAYNQLQVGCSLLPSKGGPVFAGSRKQLFCQLSLAKLPVFSFVAGPRPARNLVQKLSKNWPIELQKCFPRLQSRKCFPRVMLGPRVGNTWLIDREVSATRNPALLEGPLACGQAALPLAERKGRCFFFSAESESTS